MDKADQGATIDAQPVDEAAAGASDLKPLLDKMEDALASAIGPVAGVVLQDCLSKWKAAGPEVPARLSELAAMLADEIGDPGMVQEFTARIEELM